MTDVPAELARLRARITAVEARLENEAGLRAMVDMDQAAITTRLDAQQTLLRALARTQSDHTAQLREQGAQLREQGAQLREQGAQLREHGVRLDRVQAGIGRVEVGVQAILGLLGSADGRAGTGTSEP
jgi:chromosome segregation ATPase